MSHGIGGAAPVNDRPFAEVPPLAGPRVALHRRACFDNTPDSIGAARDLTRDFLACIPDGVAVLSERAAGDVLLVVSELVTNARRHAGGPLLLDLACTAHEVEVTVWDTSPELPARFARDPGRIGGHGIEIVASVCSRFDAVPVPGGKRVHACIPLE